MAYTEEPIRYPGVFISYSREESSRYARALQKVLARTGTESFDPVASVPDPDAWDQAREALSTSKAMILVATPRALRSEWVRREVGVFLGLGRGELAIIDVGGALEEAAREDPFWRDATDRHHSFVLKESPSALEKGRPSRLIVRALEGLGAPLPQLRSYSAVTLSGVWMLIFGFLLAAALAGLGLYVMRITRS